MEPQTQHLTAEQWTRIEAPLFAGRKIEAIKLLREFSGCGLAEAKQILDEHERVLRAQAPERFTSPSGRGCALAAILLAGFLALLLAPVLLASNL